MSALIWRWARAWALAGGVLTLAACTCQDSNPPRSDVKKLTSEEQQPVDVDRIRFKLVTAEDYAKEAYLSIDEDNLDVEFEALRHDIEADVAAPSGVAPAASNTPRLE